MAERIRVTSSIGSWRGRKGQLSFTLMPEMYLGQENVASQSENYEKRVSTVKENQGHLLEDIQATVEKDLDGLLPGAAVDGYCKVESGHGRDEERSYVVIHNVEQIRDRDEWANLTTVGMCRSVRT